MIQAEITPVELVAGQEASLTIRLVNSGPGTCSSVVFKLVMPTELPVIGGNNWVEVNRLKAGEEATSVVRVRPEAPGRWIAGSTNFSYRDRHGFSRRVEDFQAEFCVTLPAQPELPPEPRVQLRIITDELPHQEWGRLRGRVENIGEVALCGVHVEATGQFTVDSQRELNLLGAVQPGQHVEFEFAVRADDAGEVPVHVTVSFRDCLGRQHRREHTGAVSVHRGRHDAKPVRPDRTRILFLAANPVDTRRIRWENDFKEIEDALLRSRNGARFELRNCFASRDKDISHELFDFRPHLVHFAGHGLQDGRLLVESETNRARPASVSGLARLFEQTAEFVTCVVLSTCDSWSLAEALSKHIGHVIGMSDRIDDRSAIKFSIGFYQALAGGNPVERAFQAGLALVEMQPHHGVDHEIPRLFARSYRGT